MSKAKTKKEDIRKRVLTKAGSDEHLHQTEQARLNAFLETSFLRNGRMEVLFHALRAESEIIKAGFSVEGDTNSKGYTYRCNVTLPTNGKKQVIKDSVHEHFGKLYEKYKDDYCIDIKHLGLYLEHVKIKNEEIGEIYCIHEEKGLFGKIISVEENSNTKGKVFTCEYQTIYADKVRTFMFRTPLNKSRIFISFEDFESYVHDLDYDHPHRNKYLNMIETIYEINNGYY